MATTVVFTGTPEAFARMQREIKEKERREAAKVAKARAARYNLTLRAKDLKKAKEEAAAIESKRTSLLGSLAKRLSGMRRGSKRSSVQSTEQSEPDAAKARAESAAAQQEQSPNEEEQEQVQQQHEEDEDEEEEEEEEVVMWMGELAKALESQAAYDINFAIVSAFLSEVAPERLDEVDAMLEEFSGREEDLFNELAEKYRVAESSQRKLRADTLKALEAVPDDAEEEEGEGGGYILSIMGDNFGKWAANVQTHVLKQRMLQAGASQEDVNAILNNRSEMI